MKISDLPRALKIQAQMQALDARRASVTSAMAVTMGNVTLQVADDATEHGTAITVPAEALAAIRDMVLSVLDGQATRLKSTLTGIGVEEG